MAGTDKHLMLDGPLLSSFFSFIKVIQLLNELYTLFDSIIKHYDVYKVETVGDAYLCVSGLPRPNGDRHAVEIAMMALEFIQSLKNFKIKHKSGADKDLQMRIGKKVQCNCHGLTKPRLRPVTKQIDPLPTKE